MSQHGDEGGAAEEAVRLFFRDHGYFAVRGIKFRYGNQDVTDVDLWAYNVGSSTHRERVVTDCKFKRERAQGFERVLWVEGLRYAVGAESAVLATTDRRDEVRALAVQMGMQVIGPDILEYYIQRNKDTERLSEEELLSLVLPNEDKLSGKLRERLENSKSALLQLDFDSINAHVEDLRYHVTETSRRSNPTTAARLFYLTSAYLLITLDYVLRDANFLTENRIKGRIDEGLRFGTRGRVGAMALLDAIGAKKKSEALRAAERMRADIPAEYFARYAGDAWYFKTAIALENAAYSRAFIPASELPIEAQGVIGVLLDFLQIQRSAIFNVIEPF